MRGDVGAARRCSVWALRCVGRVGGYTLGDRGGREQGAGGRGKDGGGVRTKSSRVLGPGWVGVCVGRLSEHPPNLIPSERSSEGERASQRRPDNSRTHPFSGSLASGRPPPRVPAEHTHTHTVHTPDTHTPPSSVGRMAVVWHPPPPLRPCIFSWTQALGRDTPSQVPPSSPLSMSGSSAERTLWRLLSCVFASASHASTQGEEIYKKTTHIPPIAVHTAAQNIDLYPYPHCTVLS